MTGNIVIKCLGLAGRTFTREGKLPPKGQFLKSYDPEAHSGWGFAEWTANPDEAMKFASMEAAWQCWRTVPESRPRRPDGMPNRPLTAFTIEVEAIGGDGEE